MRYLALVSLVIQLLAPRVAGCPFCKPDLRYPSFQEELARHAAVAFGEPISHRQAVAFAIADMATELEGMRLATWRAASRAERGESFTREAKIAHLLASEHGMKIGSMGVQLLGGHGYIREHPVERWYRQLRGVAVLAGGLIP